MTVLVTGSTGLVGNNVVRRLLGDGRKVRVVVRSERSTLPIDDLDLEIVNGDICDRDSLRAAVRGVDLVIHCAGYVHIGWTGKERAEEVNVGGTQNISVVAREVGAKMVHVSSADTLGAGLRDQLADEETRQVYNPPIPYVVTKTAGEAEVRRQVELGLDAVIVNPGYMLGPWDWKPSSGRMLIEVAKGRPPLAPRGGTTVCDVRDVAEGILLASEKGRRGANYILGGENMTYLELWKMFAEVADIPKPICRMGPLMVFGAGLVGDVWCKLTGTEGTVNSAAMKMSVVYHYYSSRRAEEELGYHCRPARTSIMDAWEWFQAHGYMEKLPPEEERMKASTAATMAKSSSQAIQ
ncbi:NAD-dependent epimerase/dehydratase family protein [Blastopirellula sp. J2-11]|uniref:NAD-dependent epimerase/dehydratase family protein n=1 Tax=Blastopirellula sp. J2-11 TaxID=2943192 RepID=UPI0021C85839|nr:NAD-dependent epimerase/dehydratase family protein [Blastopirellula sp. J2-11]UUO06883.1 NAD-dependent epimerase/dehydratase family protein [Blastopirellula sp. J2-11]